MYQQRDIQDLDQNQGQDHDLHPKHQKKIVDASRNVDTSLKTSIDTSQNLEESEMSTHHDDGNRSLPCNKSIRGKRHSRSRSRSLSLSPSLKPSPKIPSELTDCGLDDSRTLSTSLTYDDREEEALSSGPDSQNNGYKGPSLCPRQSDKPLPQDGKVSEIALKSHLIIVTLLLNKLW